MIVITIIIVFGSRSHLLITACRRKTLVCLFEQTYFLLDVRAFKCFIKYFTHIHIFVFLCVCKELTHKMQAKTLKRKSYA